MNLLDLFAGIGGFSLAAHWMGWKTVAFVEKEPFCQKVLRKNFGQDIEIHDDMFTFDGRPFRGTVDIITGGFPCQPFSAAGKRKGRADERHLFPQMLRVISEVKPRWVVAENVRGLLSIESGSVFAEVVTSLESEGYEVITFCVPASAVEAPHRRDRLWIVANAGRSHGERRSDAGEFETPSREWIAARFEQTDPDIIIADAASDGSSERSAEAARTVGRGERGRMFEFEGVNSNAADAERLRRGRRGDYGRAYGRALVLQGEQTGRAVGHQDEGCYRNAQSRWHELWLDVAARTCVRGVDDGLSDELHITGSRDNRGSRLKALGNSIVPQIAFEIFRAIENSEYEKAKPTI